MKKLPFRIGTIGNVVIKKPKSVFALAVGLFGGIIVLVPALVRLEQLVPPERIDYVLAFVLGVLYTLLVIKTVEWEDSKGE